MKAYISELINEAIGQISSQEAVRVLGTSVFDVSYPKHGFGDYATNVAMVLFKKFNDAPAKNPTEFARLLADHLIKLDRKDTFTKIEAQGGFINFWLSKQHLVANLQTILDAKEQFGCSEQGANQKVLVEYFQPNIAKPLHLGHLRTAIIGDSLFRILQFSGFNVESDTHLGDWGTQFGLLLLAYKKWGDQAVVEADPIAELNKLYVKINSEIEADETLREQGKAEFVKLEQGDSENIELWKQFKNWSWQEFSIIYDELGVRKADHDWPESFYADKMPAVLEELKTKGLLVDSQGAQIVNLEEHNLGVAVVVKSDGGTTYLLRDLATFIYRKQQGFEKQLYIVDNRQSHTLAQTFKILELLGIITSPSEAIHIAYGVLSLPEGQMSTRKGTMVGAKELIRKAQEKALEIINEKNPGLEDKDVVSKQVMQAALKYFDLSHNYKSDIVFTWDKALSFEGNTGPYLQYTHARINGILRKYHHSGDFVTTSPREQGEEGVELIDSELMLLRKLQKFPEIITQTAENYSPNIISNYLFELSQIFNTFYEAVPIIKETDAAKQSLRIKMITATAQVLNNGLSLLGIKAPEEM
ncbi:MAG TPA: arginine--tRNA ligase [Candidatus Doudnabacteria bacterium]|nr:arginine--tRNA ligase [Candidatus Doudnabacteria bacterium]